MPELPDVTIYIETLATRIVGKRLLRVRLLNPFLLRTALPPIATAENRTVLGVQRVGKRIVIALEGELYLVLHLMIAGRLRWLEGKEKPPGRIALALLEFENGVLVFTEAGTKRRAAGGQFGRRALQHTVWQPCRQRQRMPSHLRPL